MAINAEQDQLNKNENSQQPMTTGGGPSDAAGSRVAAYSSGSQSQAPTQGSGRFTNLKNYVNANEGAGQQLGSRITGNIDKNLTKTKNEAQTQAGQISQNINAEKDRLAEGSTFNQQLKQDPTQIAANQDTSGRFGKLLNNQNVASNLATQAQTTSDAANAGLNNVNQQVQNLGTEQGRFNLLQQAVKQPGYTTGQQRLDQLFLQAGDPNQLAQNQRNLSKQLGTTQADLTNQFNTIGTGVNEVGSQAEQIASMLGGTLGSETQNLTNAQIEEAQKLNTDNSTGNSALQTYFSNGYGALQDPAQKTFIDQQLASGGLNNQLRTYNVLQDPQSFMNYINQGRTDLTQADVVDQNELNRYQALASLGGITNPAFTKVGEGGGASGIQSGKLLTDIDAAKNAYVASLADKNVAGRGDKTVNGVGRMGPGGANVAADYGANLQNLFNQYDTNSQNMDALTGIDQKQYAGHEWGGSASGLGINRWFNTGNNPYSDQGKDALSQAQGAARQDILNQFLESLNAGGYNKLLGG